MRKSAAISSALLALALTLSVFSSVPASAAGRQLESKASVESSEDGSATQSHEATLSTEQMASATSVSASRADFELLAQGGPWSDPAPAFFISNQLDGAPECAPGYVCMRIQAGPQGYTEFWYYEYGRYALQNWFGEGWLNNRQTDGATLRLYDEFGDLIFCYQSHPEAAISNQDWTLVYYIELSPASNADAGQCF
jgi:hypothetical protein